ncbi:tripartite motif-containing protein 6-like [Rana temporaria]|uniref:tripartite motif-containing protein 6-like n=1 Tax=Rana temporaria TaxID=8407 RepID=UPI001AAC937B|nr:tripartite motif-containing protein 6-like [Rana temporaria]
MYLCFPTSLENRKCSVHKKILEYYCTEDSSCICVSCRLDGEHRGHQVETLDEASEMKKLRNVLQKLMTEREKMAKRVQSLQEHRRKVQGKADDETERVTVQDLEIKEKDLSRKMVDIEELCNMTDRLTVLQESDTGDLCDTEDGDDEDRERRDKLLHDAGDLDVAGISYTLHTGLSYIMSGKSRFKDQGLLVVVHNIGAVAPDPLELAFRNSTKPRWMMAAGKGDETISVSLLEKCASGKNSIFNTDVKVKEIDFCTTSLRFKTYTSVIGIKQRDERL